MASSQGAFELHYRVPVHPHLGSFGGGLGPYLYSTDFNEHAESLNALITLYVSYALSESARLVAFDATAVSSRWSSDFGLYLNTESSRVLDEHVSLVVMLGAHVVVFRQEGLQYRLSAPQGVEIIVRDLPLRGFNLTAGGFFFPILGGRSYLNGWLRYGRGGYFGEINFIDWRETVGDRIVGARSLGLSFGMPFFGFL